MQCRLSLVPLQEWPVDSCYQTLGSDPIVSAVEPCPVLQHEHGLGFKSPSFNQSLAKDICGTDKGRDVRKGTI